MAKFLRTKGIAKHLEDIIIQAKDHLVLVTPYLKLSSSFFDRLIQADSRENINITIIFGKDDLQVQEWKKLERLRNLTVLYFPSLHAKCYFNEREMIIGSMNFYEYSENNNVEMAILLDAIQDKQVYEDGVEEVGALLKSDRLEVALVSNNHDTSDEPINGHCIRCNGEIPYDLGKPLCFNHYRTWANFGDYEYPEKYCHTCGGSTHGKTSMMYPQCSKCFKNSGMLQKI
ncbi:phospholipase D family protein [Fulvivirga sp. 29W222]|uniref:Phospholipase D family protein n=1 Tax=Fulvivirga marina TaxID=2494733 RepID=A0A937KD49_9BACT|nr:phospholipase D family protein [Fulvivirga marina]MBL6445670.1 phospholipase D family protein [Fulvivirga marina]